MNEPDVAIIGAGAAGIGAARKLAAGGLKTLLLDALPRAGGRAFTQSALGMPFDLGCGWLHSGDRNPWTQIAEKLGFEVDRSASAWGSQFLDLGFTPAQQNAARDAFARWTEHVATTPPVSDIAAGALDPTGLWTNYLQALSGYISGDELERISCKDYTAYDEASTGFNWRVPVGYGTVVTASIPANTALSLLTPVQSVSVDNTRVVLETTAGSVRARAVIVTASTNVLAGGSIRWPSSLDPWRDAASRLPLGYNEKLFLEIVGSSPFEDETHIIGDPHDATTGSYYIRPFGRPVIECFLGGAGARVVAEQGSKAAFARATDQLVALFGNDVLHKIRPLLASEWTRTPSIGGAYSHALPGQADARAALARPFDGRLFFAGEATHTTDFSTAHGAFQSGVRAAEEVIAALANITS